MLQALASSLLPFPITTISFFHPSSHPKPCLPSPPPPVPAWPPAAPRLRLLLPALSGLAMVGPSSWVRAQQDPLPGAATRSSMQGAQVQIPGGTRGEPWVWNKARESFFSCPAVESTCEQDDLFLQRFITWQNLGGGFLQASSTFLTHKPKSCHISSPFSKAWGHEEKVTKFLETWRWGERVYFLPAKWSATT